jgi:RNA polymerase sigma-70 factor (ECF subfamily)
MDLYERHGRALLRKAERMLGNSPDAQDAVQALFVDLLQKNEPHDLLYLYRAITNRCLTFLRDERNRARLLAENDDALRGPVRTTCDDRVVGVDLLVKLTRVLDQRELEILAYRYFDDMTQEEISAMVGLSRKTVGKTLDTIKDAITNLTDGERP